MKRVAENACYLLAVWIVEGCSFAWTTADRIERRFAIVGCTEAFVARHEKARREHLTEQSKRHDVQHPDRLTYLHR